MAASPRAPGEDSLIASSALLRSFPAEALDEVLAACERLSLPAGAVLFRQGEPGDALYLVCAGRVGVVMSVDGADQLIDEYGPGDSVGELALISGRARAARGFTLTAAELLRLPAAGFAALAARHPEAIKRFADTLLPRLRRSQLVAVLTPLFGVMDRTTLHDIIGELTWLSLPSGAALFRQSDPGAFFAIVVSGRLRVEREGPGGRGQFVNELGRGQYVGELAVLTGEPRSATVVAIRDSDLVLLGRDAFFRLLGQHPQVMMQITRVVVNRLQRAIAAPAVHERELSVALVAAHDDLPLDGLAARLAEALAALGPAMHLSSARVDRMLGRPGHAQMPEDHPANVTLRSWLSEREAEHRYMLYEADALGSPWSQRCLRRADLILVVGRAGGPSAAGPVEAEIGRLGLQARRELVLLHAAGAARPAGTRAWLEGGRFAQHHHVRPDSPDDIGRLARMIAGRGLGLVLSGGGARGFAHIGVIRALEEAGLAPDAVGGSSIGALIAGAYARGMGWREMDLLARGLIRHWRVPDYTLPAVSLLRGQKLTESLRRVFGDGEIEDLWRSFYCLSVNLTRLQPVVHRSGPLWRAVRASTSLPLIFPPLLEGGEVLVDGAVVDTLPVTQMRALCPQGQVIGVDVSAEFAMANASYRFGPSISGWQLLASRLAPQESRVVAPSMVDTLLRLLEFSSVAALPDSYAQADLVIRPEVAAFGTLAFGEYERIAALGYGAARQQIAAWRAGASAT